MNDQIQQLKETLHEIIQADQADLDFGIYRIMRQKRAELDEYLEVRLLQDLRLTAARQYEETTAMLQERINAARKQAYDLGFNPDEAPKVKELRAALEELSLKENLEESVLSDLVEFLRRYYKDGDFLSLPRYRKNSYAIEYNGEEVKLHWANADQYYVKTAERFRDYRFTLPHGAAVHFKITAANTETGNNKSESGKERRFQLVEGEFMREERGELLIFFRYEPDADKRKQADINRETAQRILEAEGFLEWRNALGRPAPTETNRERTMLDKRLADYTARNAFDYFIHKDLDAFLRRELDFYIKNEIVRLDDIENEDAPRVELYLAKVKALRRVGHKIIAFLAQVENLQKKLFLKKKFVVRAEYCATLDRVPRQLWPDILANEAQIAEWRQLYAIDEIQADLFNGGHHLNEQFLETNPSLVIDTRHFPEAWKQTMLASFTDLDNATDGLLIKADNFHALNLLQEKYREAVRCVHIDPPYNTDTSGFLYKNGYQHSSWLSMMENRCALSFGLMADDGSFLCHIDENEYERLRMLCELMTNGFINTIIWDKRNPMNAGQGVATQHEYIIWQTKRSEPLYLRNDSIISMLEAAQNIVKKHGSVSAEARKEFARWIDTNDNLSGGEKSYRFLDDDGNIYQSVSLRAPEPRTDPKFFQPLIHPVTNNPCPVPPNGFSRTPDTLQAMIGRGEILFGSDETTQPRQKVLLTSESRRQISSVVQDAKKGKSDLSPLGLDFPYCHPTSLYEKLVGTAASMKTDIVLDFFAGSGTTAHAVINLNREDGGRRKYILVETNEYFDTVTLPRVKKVVYSKDWKDGKPVSRVGSSHLVQYFALESYEDALNNLCLRRTEEQEQGLLKFTDEFREDYLLNYCLEFEAAGSQSLLNLDNFAAPFDYRMNLAFNGVGETRETSVDLVETFNYLIGLRVQTIQQIDGFRVVRGATRAGERCMILWRTTKDLAPELADKRLNDFLVKANFDFNAIDTLYINGDAAIPVGPVRRENAAWQIKMIETEFLRRMFEE
jgi:adenine-specific DNA-methyltransferase